MCTSVGKKHYQMVYVQLSSIRGHVCSSNGNFCKFIMHSNDTFSLQTNGNVNLMNLMMNMIIKNKVQLLLLWFIYDLAEYKTVPSGWTVTSISWRPDPMIFESCSLTMYTCGVHTRSLSLFSPCIEDLEDEWMSLSSFHRYRINIWAVKC